jgi:peptide-methionine (R)-S-oxide reductase
MTPTPSTVATWHTTLRPDVYQALTQGIFEQPGKGAYVRVGSPGVYLCCGCGAPLFLSIHQRTSMFGFATFTHPATEQAVQTTVLDDSTDNASGGVPITCTSCGGRVGFMTVERGTTEQMYHVSSRAVQLRLDVSRRKYFVRFFAAVCTIVALGYMGWVWSGYQFGDSDRSHATVPVQLGDAEVRAVVVHLDQPNASTSGIVVRQEEVLLFVLDDAGGVPGITFANHSVDILWLDDHFTVVGWERERASQSTQALKRPSAARYGLIAQIGTMTPEVFATGFVVTVPETVGAL